MSIPPKQAQTAPSLEYQKAEQFIDHSISNMGTESHIEYDTTMTRNSQPTKWKKWLHRLLKLHS